MILYINCCPRTESRTAKLAASLLQKLDGEFTEVFLPEKQLFPVDDAVIKARSAALCNNDFSCEMFSLAKQFAKADQIVIAAPFWDLSFPALLKLYLENIYVQGVVTRFNPDGSQTGLCRATKLFYVSTAGGDFSSKYGYDYVSELVKTCFGVRDTELVYAERLDLEGNDPDSILRETIKKYGLS